MTLSIMFVHSVNFFYRCRSSRTTMLMHFGNFNTVTTTLKVLANWLLGILYGICSSFTVTIQPKTTLILLYCARWNAQNWVWTMEWMSNTRYLKMSLGKSNGKFTDYKNLVFTQGWTYMKLRQNLNNSIPVTNVARKRTTRQWKLISV